MLITITSENVPLIKFKEQKDYQYFSSDRFDVFIYGYPYVLCENSYKWVGPKDIIDLFLKVKLKFVNKIDGVFTIFIYDKNNKVNYVITDPYGIYNLFYWKSNTEIYIFDDLEETFSIIDGIAFNMKAVYSQLVTGYGFRIGTETQLANIFSFLRGSIYTVSKEKFEQTQYWSGTEKQDVRKDTFFRYMKQHMERSLKLDGKKVFTISGGYDTSTIITPVINKNFRLASFGIESSDDIKSARTVAKKYKKELETFILGENFIENFKGIAKKYYNMFNGLVPHIHYIEFLLMVSKVSESADILYLGFLGDEIWRYCGFKELNLNRFINTDVFDCFTSYSQADFIYDIEKIYHNRHILHFLLDNYASNFGSCLIKMLGKYIKIFLGMMNKNILEMLNSPKITYDERLSGNLQREFIKEQDRFIYKNLKKIKKINPIKIYSNKIFNRVFHKNLYVNYPNKPHTFDVWLRNYYHDYIIRILIDGYDGMILKDCFHKTILRDIVLKYLKGDNKYFTFIITLLSLEFWFRGFINKEENKIE